MKKILVGDMNKLSRTKNSLMNIGTGMIVQFINKIMGFISRSVFIYILNTEYLGINGLFTNILSVLSFAEMGIGSAIIYNLYKPVAQGNTERIKSLMWFYKKAYIIIGCAIFSLGILLIPFLNDILTNVPNIKEDIVIIYLMYLIDTCVSYFFTYKKSIIIAHQRQRIINNFDSIFYLLRSILQIIFLVLTKQFLLFLAIQIIGTFIENILLSRIADRNYPYLKDKDIKKLSKSETNSIFKNVKSLAIYQFGAVIMNGTDNILISTFIGISVVGLCSNYTLLLNSVKTVLSSGLSSLTASVGNLNATSNVEKKEKLYKEITLVYFFIYSFCAISFIILSQPFIILWIGKNYLLSIIIAVSLGINFFIEGIRMPGYMFRTTLGLFENAKITPYIGAVSNLFFSILLCRKIGLVGIYIGTCISQVISYFWIDPYIIYKYDFVKSSKCFFKRLFIYFFIFVLEIILCIFISSNFTGNTLVIFLKSCALVLILPNFINVVFFYKTSEFYSLKNRFILPILEKISYRCL